jgi:hypothetical protein
MSAVGPTQLGIPTQSAAGKERPFADHYWCHCGATSPEIQMTIGVVNDDAAGLEVGLGCRHDDQVDLAAVGELGEDPFVRVGHPGDLVAETVDEAFEVTDRAVHPRPRSLEVLAVDAHRQVQVRERVTFAASQRAAERQPDNLIVGLA